MSPISTADVAKIVGVNRATIERWLQEGEIPKPKPLRVGRKVFRHWTNSDIRRLKRYKAAHYWEGRGRPPKKKRKT